MRALKYLTIVPAILALAACFMSDTPLLPEGEAILMVQAPVAFCDEEDSCEPAVIEGDAYKFMPPPDEPGEQPAYIRFTHLMGQGDDAVYLGEARLTDEDDETVWYHFVSRALPDAEDGTHLYQLVQPDCTEATAAQKETYGIKKLDNYSCSIGSWQDLSDYLLEAHADDFADPDWWYEEF